MEILQFFATGDNIWLLIVGAILFYGILSVIFDGIVDAVKALNPSHKYITQCECDHPREVNTDREIVDFTKTQVDKNI